MNNKFVEELMTPNFPHVSINVARLTETIIN